MDGLNKMCVFSAVIKPTLGNIIRRGGVMIPKFRAWLKAGKIMLPVGEIDFDYEFAYLDEENGYRS